MYGPRGNGGIVPGVRTARHSSSVRWSGNDILLEELLKRLPRKGIVGMDLRGCLRKRL